MGRLLSFFQGGEVFCGNIDVAKVMASPSMFWMSAASVRVESCPPSRCLGDFVWFEAEEVSFWPDRMAMPSALARAMEE
jgi:hypothetical protein